MADRTLVPDKLQGYLLQVRHMLFELITLDLKTTVSVEAFDDVALQIDDTITAEQLKSVTSGNNPTADRSAVFWKTIFNWCTYIESGMLDKGKVKFRFIVVANRPIPCGEIAKSFAESSTEEQARDALTRAKQKILFTSEGVRRTVPESYKNYVNYIFSQDHEKTVLDVIQDLSITLFDGDYNERLIERFNSQQVPPEYADVLLLYMLGWVTDKVQEQTQKNLPAYISAQEFHDVLQSQIRARDLNTILTALSTEPTTKRVNDELNRKDTYIKQLGYIEVDTVSIFTAANDFLRSKAEKVIWAEKGIITPQSFSEFNDDLVRTWKSTKELNDLDAHSSEVVQGKRLYYKCCLAVDNKRIQGVKPPTFFSSGCLHSLANTPALAPKIGWHPQYTQLLLQEGQADE